MSDDGKDKDIDERNRRGAMFLDALYDETADREAQFANVDWLAQQLNFAPEIVRDICILLEGEGLVEYAVLRGAVNRSSVALTADGRKLVLERRTGPK